MANDDEARLPADLRAFRHACVDSIGPLVALAAIGFLLYGLVWDAT